MNSLNRGSNWMHKNHVGAKSLPPPVAQSNAPTGNPQSGEEPKAKMTRLG